MDKFVQEKLTEEYHALIKKPDIDSILTTILNNPTNFPFIEVIERKHEDEYSVDGFIIFKFDNRYYKARFYDHSYGETSIEVRNVEQVFPQEKTILVFE